MKTRCFRVVSAVVPSVVGPFLVILTTESFVLKVHFMFALCFTKLEAGQITEEKNNATRLLLIMEIIVLKLFTAALLIKD